ncbi:MAG: hypothetical protein JWM76_3859 [Pseudonocardiales bacterium]|nr:hypothetical protein [Pseudonocardiales bacterium]
MSAMSAMSAELTHLRSVRRHVLGILDGLDDNALRRPMLPSGWSALGLVRHLTIDVERFWFSAVIAGEPAAIAATGGDGDAWQVPADAPTTGILDAYLAAAQLSDAIIAVTDPDASPQWWPDDIFGDWRLHDAHDIVLHVIVETACHAGHLDAARELIDGRQWMVLS